MKLILLLLLINPAFAQYLGVNDVDVSTFSPPIDDSRDWEFSLNQQKNRTNKSCAKASFEAQGTARAFFGPPYGPLTKEEANGLVEFQEKLFQEIKKFSRPIKEKFKRARPFSSPKIMACIPKENSYSYLSGHATIATIAAEAFATLFPERAEALKVRAQEIRMGRVIGGVHFKSDVEDGAKLGHLIFEALMNNQQFLDDLSKLRY